MIRTGGATPSTGKTVSGNGVPPKVEAQHRGAPLHNEWSDAKCLDPWEAYRRAGTCHVEPCPRHDPDDYAVLSRADGGSRHKKGDE